jgi:hypothetical protein
MQIFSTIWTERVFYSESEEEASSQSYDFWSQFYDFEIYNYNTSAVVG